MGIFELLTLEAVIPQMKVDSKKQALQELSSSAARLTGVEEHTIFEVLLERERLGTTGVGNGIAIPHGKLDNVKQIYGVFARLETPVDFDAIDDQPVDLIFVLLAPESAGADHLKALAWVSRLLRDNSICEKIRQSENGESILNLICSSTPPHAA